MSNKINIESLTHSTLDKANTEAKIDTMRAAGKTDTEIAKAVLGDISAREESDLLIMVKMMDIHKYMNKYIVDNDTPRLRITFAGFYHLMNHQDQHTDAIEWVKLLDTAVTVRDLWGYFLDVNRIEMTDVQSLTGYDNTFFQELLNLPIAKLENFGLNAAECK
jgi:hypothetical protein